MKFNFPTLTVEADSLDGAFETYREFVSRFDISKAEETPEAEAALAKNVEENAAALERAGFSVFVPKDKGFKEIK